MNRNLRKHLQRYNDLEETEKGKRESRQNKSHPKGDEIQDQPTEVLNLKEVLEKFRRRADVPSRDEIQDQPTEVLNFKEVLEKFRSLASHDVPSKSHNQFQNSKDSKVSKESPSQNDSRVSVESPSQDDSRVSVGSLNKEGPRVSDGSSSQEVSRVSDESPGQKASRISEELTAQEDSRISEEFSTQENARVSEESPSQEDAKLSEELSQENSSVSECVTQDDSKASEESSRLEDSRVWEESPNQDEARVSEESPSQKEVHSYSPEHCHSSSKDEMQDKSTLKQKLEIPVEKKIPKISVLLTPNHNIPFRDKIQDQSTQKIKFVEDLEMVHTLEGHPSPSNNDPPRDKIQDQSTTWELKFKGALEKFQRLEDHNVPSRASGIKQVSKKPLLSGRLEPTHHNVQTLNGTKSQRQTDLGFESKIPTLSKSLDPPHRIVPSQNHNQFQNYKDSMVFDESPSQEDARVSEDSPSKEDPSVSDESLSEDDSSVSEECLTQDDSKSSDECVTQDDSKTFEASPRQEVSRVSEESPNQKELQSSGPQHCQSSSKNHNQFQNYKDSMVSDESPSQKDARVSEDSPSKEDPSVSDEPLSEYDSSVYEECLTQDDPKSSDKCVTQDDSKTFEASPRQEVSRVSEESPNQELLQSSSPQHCQSSSKSHNQFQNSNDSCVSEKSLSQEDAWVSEEFLSQEDSRVSEEFLTQDDSKASMECLTQDNSKASECLTQDDSKISEKSQRLEDTRVSEESPNQEELRSSIPEHSQSLFRSQSTANLAYMGASPSRGDWRHSGSKDRTIASTVSSPLENARLSLILDELSTREESENAGLSRSQSTANLAYMGASPSRGDWRHSGSKDRTIASTISSPLENARLSSILDDLSIREESENAGLSRSQRTANLADIQASTSRVDWRAFGPKDSKIATRSQSTANLADMGASPSRGDWRIASKNETQSYLPEDLDSKSQAPLVSHQNIHSHKEDQKDCSTLPAALKTRNFLKERLKLRAKDAFSKHHSTCNGLDIRILKMETNYLDVSNKVKVLSFGTVRNGYPTKSVLVLGTLESNKTTLISGMVNFMFGIDFDDNFRLRVPADVISSDRLIEDESKTDFITVYKFNFYPGMPFNCNVVLIDVPDFGHPQGIERDKQTTQVLEKYLKNDNIIEISGVCVAIPASTTYATPTQKYVLDALISILGKNIAQVIEVMVTFSDNDNVNQEVIKQLEKANVVYSDIYFINNNSIFQKNVLANDYENNDFEKKRLNWSMACDDITKFFTDIGKTDQLLTQTRMVLLERRFLYKAVNELLVCVCPCRTHTLEKASDRINIIAATLQSLVFEIHKRTEQDMNFLNFKDDADIKSKLKGCSGKYCSYLHEEVMLTNKEDKDEIKLEESIETLIRDIEIHMNNIKEIAYMPDPLLACEFIDSMIETEKNEVKSAKRIQFLHKQKLRAMTIEQIMNPLDRKERGTLNEHFQNQSTSTVRQRTQSVLRRLSLRREKKN